MMPVVEGGSDEKGGVAMKLFILGVLLGSLLTGVAVQAKDPLGLGRSDKQIEFDYFRERALQLDVENMRKQQEEDRLKTLGRNPC